MMNAGPFDNLPPLSKSDALRILKTPIKDLALSSDYYKAVFHLSKYYCSESEKALLDLVKSDSKEASVLLAKRKAIEVLGRMKCKKAIPYIGKALNSSDPFIVENSAWALQEIGCNNIDFHNCIGSLLDNPNHNHRVLIQSLAKMNAITQLSKIEKVYYKDNISPGIKGASIAAIKILTGKLSDTDLLRNYLDLDNQNDRQAAVQDVIDSQAYKLLGYVLKTPISPFFRIRALDLLWPKIQSEFLEFNILNSIEFVLLEDPREVRLIKNKICSPDVNLLIHDLFSPDFNQCYASLKLLLEQKPSEILLALENNWDKLKKDYGVVYFLVILFRYMDISLLDFKKIGLELIEHCLDQSWSPFMKFKPQAILLSCQLDTNLFKTNFDNWLDESISPNWLCRYSALMCYERLIENNKFNIKKDKILEKKTDSNKFVRLKAKYILKNLFIE